MCYWLEEWDTDVLLVGRVRYKRAIGWKGEIQTCYWLEEWDTDVLLVGRVRHRRAIGWKGEIQTCYWLEEWDTDVLLVGRVRYKRAIGWKGEIQTCYWLEGWDTDVLLVGRVRYRRAIGCMSINDYLWHSEQETEFDGSIDPENDDSEYVSTESATKDKKRRPKKDKDATAVRRKVVLWISP